MDSRMFCNFSNHFLNYGSKTDEKGDTALKHYPNLQSIFPPWLVLAKLCGDIWACI